MGNVDKIENTNPKVAGPTPMEVAQLEDHLAMAELESLIGKSQSWSTHTDDDHIYTARAPGVSLEMAKKLQKGEIPPNKSIDLHGMTRQEAHQFVRRTLLASRRDGHRCLHVVTGRGQSTFDGHGVLKEALPTAHQATLEHPCPGSGHRSRKTRWTGSLSHPHPAPQKDMNALTLVEIVLWATLGLFILDAVTGFSMRTLVVSMCCVGVYQS